MSERLKFVSGEGRGSAAGLLTKGKSNAPPSAMVTSAAAVHRPVPLWLQEAAAGAKRWWR
jgi:hypothetical protein